MIDACLFGAIGLAKLRGRGYLRRSGSLATPLNGDAVLVAKNRPVTLSRLTHVEFLGLKVCDLSVTEPTR